MVTIYCLNEHGPVMNNVKLIREFVWIGRCHDSPPACRLAWAADCLNYPLEGSGRTVRCLFGAKHPCSLSSVVFHLDDAVIGSTQCITQFRQVTTYVNRHWFRATRIIDNSQDNSTSVFMNVKPETPLTTFAFLKKSVVSMKINSHCGILRDHARLSPDSSGLNAKNAAEVRDFEVDELTVTACLPTITQQRVWVLIS
tara:strand:+ start:24815 stop:25408 length:594 start_codon:yes stop_codon:yes gene_type:complete